MERLPTISCLEPRGVLCSSNIRVYLKREAGEKSEKEFSIVIYFR